jgi:hypothetical protein
MRKYGTVAPTFWTQGTGKKLRECPNAQRVALYLMTAPTSNMIGLYHICIPTIAHEVGMTIEEAEGAMKALGRPFEGETDPFLVWDSDTELVFVRTMARRQIGLEKGQCLKPGDKRIPGIVSALKECSNPLLLQSFWDEYREAFHLPPPWWTGPENKGLPSPFEGGSGSFLQGQGQGQDISTGSDDPNDSHESSVVSSTLSLFENQKKETKPKPKRKESKQRKLKPNRRSVENAVWGLWRNMYAASSRDYGAYGDASADGPAMRRLIVVAEGIVLREFTKAQQPQNSENIFNGILKLFEYWFRKYLAHDGYNGKLCSYRHPLYMLESDTPKFGTPWSKGQKVEKGDLPKIPDPIKKVREA